MRALAWLTITLCWFCFGLAFAQTPITTPPLTPLPSATTEASHLFKTSSGILSQLTVTIGATSGFVLVYDAVIAPANGAVLPKGCFPVTSNGTNGSISIRFSPPWQFTFGVVTAFSTTGCFTQTLSTTAYFVGTVQ